MDNANERSYGERISSLEGSLPPTRDRLNDLHDNITGVRNKLDAAEATLRSEIRSSETTLRAEIRSTEKTLRGEINKVSGEVKALHTAVTNSTKFVARSVIVALVLILLNLIGVIIAALRII